MSTPDAPDELQCAAYLKALADPLRLQIVRGLQAGPLSVSDIALLLEQEIGTVSHHLRVLFHAGVVTTQRDGKFIYYSLTTGLLPGRGSSQRSSLDFGCCRLELQPTTKSP
ncbi:ArsR/SmtB family transcription factor [Rubripirellula lacrimiformis]|nr:metalloregulator ArsR/SmtB family transcription factor [Rubripirellula lacrimiformis]